MFGCMHFWLNFRDDFEQLFESFSHFFRSARKRPRREKCNTCHTKTYFSRCALAPAPRPLAGRRHGATITKAIDDYISDAVRAFQDFSDVAAPIVKSGVDAAAPIVKAGADAAAPVVKQEAVASK